MPLTTQGAIIALLHRLAEDQRADRDEPVVNGNYREEISGHRKNIQSIYALGLSSRLFTSPADSGLRSTMRAILGDEEYKATKAKVFRRETLRAENAKKEALARIKLEQAAAESRALEKIEKERIAAEKERRRAEKRALQEQALREQQEAAARKAEAEKETVARRAAEHAAAERASAEQAGGRAIMGVIVKAATNYCSLPGLSLSVDCTQPFLIYSINMLFRHLMLVNPMIASEEARTDAGFIKAAAKENPRYLVNEPHFSHVLSATQKMIDENGEFFSSADFNVPEIKKTLKRLERRYVVRSEMFGQLSAKSAPLAKEIDRISFIKDFICATVIAMEIIDTAFRGVGNLPTEEALRGFAMRAISIVTDMVFRLSAEHSGHPVELEVSRMFSNIFSELEPENGVILMSLMPRIIAHAEFPKSLLKGCGETPIKNYIETKRQGYAEAFKQEHVSDIRLMGAMSFAREMADRNEARRVADARAADAEAAGMPHQP